MQCIQQCTQQINTHTAEKLIPVDMKGTTVSATSYIKKTRKRKDENERCKPNIKRETLYIYIYIYKISE